MLVGCYTLDLYCDYDELVPGSAEDAEGHSPGNYMGQFTGRSRSACIRAAREAGWLFHKDDTHSCPVCIKGKRRKPR